MNKLFYLLLSVVALIGVTACKEKPQQFDRGACLYVNVKNELRAMNIEPRALEPIEGDPQEVLSPREIVEQAQVFILDDTDGYKNVQVGISDSEMKDIENARIIMRDDHIIFPDGKLNTYFLEAENIRIDNGHNQAIAYIPQSVVKKALVEIKAAYDAGEYEKVYKLFETAYTAIPCTQMQWEKLKEEGLN